MNEDRRIVDADAVTADDTVVFTARSGFETTEGLLTRLGDDHVTVFGTPGCRNPSGDHSQQYNRSHSMGRRRGDPSHGRFALRAGRVAAVSSPARVTGRVASRS